MEGQPNQTIEVRVKGLTNTDTAVREFRRPIEKTSELLEALKGENLEGELISEKGCFLTDSDPVSPGVYFLVVDDEAPALKKFKEGLPDGAGGTGGHALPVGGCVARPGSVQVFANLFGDIPPTWPRAGGLLHLMGEAAVGKVPVLAENYHLLLAQDSDISRLIEPSPTNSIALHFSTLLMNDYLTGVDASIVVDRAPDLFIGQSMVLLSRFFSVLPDNKLRFKEFWNSGEFLSRSQSEPAEQGTCPSYSMVVASRQALIGEHSYRDIGGAVADLTGEVALCNFDSFHPVDGILAYAVAGLDITFMVFDLQGKRVYSRECETHTVAERAEVLREVFKMYRALLTMQRAWGG